jgi:AAA ATPase-like protein
MNGDGGLVGRRAELTARRSAVDKAARGAGAAMFVLGEPGIGKSRLLAAAVERARAAGMAVLTGRAVAGGGAYRAVAAALAEHLRAPGSTGRGGRCSGAARPSRIRWAWTSVCGTRVAPDAGGRAAHAWVRVDGRRRSTLDLALGNISTVGERAA